MQWRGRKFSHVRVLIDNKSSVLDTSSTMILPYKSPVLAYKTPWSQPMGANQKLLPVYYGNMVFHFPGAKEINQLSSLPDVRVLIRRLESAGIAKKLIDVVLAGRDLYVSIAPEVFDLKPSPLFPSWCERIARFYGSGLGIDFTVYRPDAWIPVVGSRLPDKSYVVLLRHHELHLPDAYLLGFASTIRSLHKRRSSEPIVPSDQFHPLACPVQPRLYRNLPGGVQTMLHSELRTEKWEAACFATALAVKDVGGTSMDAELMLRYVQEERGLSKSALKQNIQRAFESAYRFGYRAFAKHFPQFAARIPDEKSPYVVFEREWARKLIEVNAPYTAHKLMYELLLAYHEYPRPVLPIPEGWSVKLLKPALQILSTLGIIDVLGKGEVRLRMDTEQREQNYLRIPVVCLTYALQTKQAVRFFSALMCASMHKKGGQWSTVKMATLATRLMVSIRTAFGYLKSLRSAGLIISEKLSLQFPILQSKNHAQPSMDATSSESNENIFFSCENKTNIGDRDTSARSLYNRMIDMLCNKSIRYKRSAPRTPSAAAKRLFSLVGCYAQRPHLTWNNRLLHRHRLTSSGHG